jgi:hypothetical protein
VKEVMDLHAMALFIPHKNINPTKIIGYNIPTKTRLFVTTWDIRPYNLEGAIEIWLREVSRKNTKWNYRFSTTTF